MARIINDIELAALIELLAEAKSDHSFTPQSMRRYLQSNLVAIDHQISLLSYQLQPGGSPAPSLIGWDGEPVPEVVKDSWTSLNYLMSARQTLASTLKALYESPTQ